MSHSPLAAKTLTVAAALFIGPGALHAQVSFSNNNTITVPDSGSGATSSNITVSGVSGTVATITVTLNSMSGHIGETDYLLVGPNSAKLVFLSNAGSVANSSSNITVTFADAGASFAPTGVFTSGATYKPTHNGSSAEAWPSGVPTPSFPTDYAAGNVANTGTGTLGNHFNGINPNGTWTLWAMDNVAGDPSVTIQGWTITITPAVLPGTTTAVSASANPATRTLPVNLIANVTSTGGTVNEGTIQFSVNGSSLGSPVAVANGNATLSNQVFNSEGTFTIGAAYSGGSNFAPSNGSFLLTVQSATTGTPPTFCDAGPVTINTGPLAPIPATPYPQQITVSGLSGTLQTVNMSLSGWTFPTPIDVDILLVSPTGQKMVVLSKVGGSISISGVNLTLDDTASVLMPNTSLLASGLYKPSSYNAGVTFAAPAPAAPYNQPATAGSATFASSFAGINPNGTWQMYVSSHTPGNTGTISGGYCLTFTTSGDALTTTSLTSSKNPAFVGDSLTFTATATRASDSAPVVGGTMSFTVDGVLASGPTPVNVSGTATFQTSTLTEATHTIVATYSGASGFATSNTSLQQEVDTPTTVTGTTYCNNGGISIPGNSVAVQYPSRIFVANQPGIVGSARVKLNNYTAAFARDHDMLLVGPAGQSIVFWSHVGASSSGFNNQNFIIDDAASSQLPSSGGVADGSYKPTAYATGIPVVFPSPAPAGPYNLAAPAGSATLGGAYSGIDPNGTWGLYVLDDVPDTSASSIGSWCVDLTMQIPNLTITKTHSGNFFQGQLGATYTIKVNNAGTGSTTGAVTVTDTVPTGLTLVSLSGSGWDCTAGNSCTRSDALAPGTSYPDITATVNVAANAGATLTNQATVAGGGESNTADDTANDPTTITPTITFDTNPTGLSFSVAGATYTSAQIQQIAAGTNLTIATTSPQTATGTQYVFLNWSDSGAISHSVTISNAVTSYIAAFQTQYQLTTSASPSAGGTVTPPPASTIPEPACRSPPRRMPATSSPRGPRMQSADRCS